MRIVFVKVLQQNKKSGYRSVVVYKGVDGSIVIERASGCMLVAASAVATCVLIVCPAIESSSGSARDRRRLDQATTARPTPICLPSPADRGSRACP